MDQDTKRQELHIAGLLFLFFFLVIAVFQMLKPLKSGLFVEYYGADIELYAKLSNIFIAALGVTVFTFLYNHLPRHQLIYVLSAFFMGSFVVIAAALLTPNPILIWAFYLLGDLEAIMMGLHRTDRRPDGTMIRRFSLPRRFTSPVRPCPRSRLVAPRRLPPMPQPPARQPALDVPTFLGSRG